MTASNPEFVKKSKFTCCKNRRGPYMRYMDDFAKIERVAILNNYQGRGLGAQLMMAILSDLKRSAEVVTAKLSS